MKDNPNNIKNVIKEINKEESKNSYKLHEYIELSRERQGYTTEFGARVLDIKHDDYLKLEKGEFPITKQMLSLLINIYKMPKKVKYLLDDPNKPEYSKKLFELRTKAERTQKETSELLGIAQTTYAGYETGKNEPDIKMLIKIAELYQTSVDYILGRYN